MKHLWNCLLLMATIASVALAQPLAGYHVARRVTIGGEGGCDYSFVDRDARRLYVSHSSRVEVLDVDSLSELGEIPGTQGVHGICVAPQTGRGFTSNGRTSTVTIFDLKTLKIIKEVPVSGKNPDCILYDPWSQRVFTFNGRSSDVSALDPATGEVVGTKDLGGKPEFAVTDLAGHVYVNIEDKSEIVCFNPATLEILSRWSIAPGEEPSGLALDVVHHRLFSVCRNELMVVSDALKGRVVATVPIGRGTDGCAFDADRQLAFSSNGEGTLTVVHEDSPDGYTVVETVPTQRGARTVSIDGKSHALFLSTAEFGEAPKPTTDNPRPRAPILPDTFCVLRVQR
jgi:DNA-binding beta-propeller fold protein YncE